MKREAATRQRQPIHPGRILKEMLLDELGISQYRLAKDIGVDPRRINAIVQGKRAITPATSLLLARYFGQSDSFWIDLQNDYDLEVERERLAQRLKRIRPAAVG